MYTLKISVLGWGVLLLALAAMLALAPPTFAVQTSQYDAFSACPTDSPALNDPASEVAICAAGVAHEGQLKVGKLTIPLSGLDLQFGAVGLGLTEPDCPEAGLCFGRAPGTTTLDSQPSVVPVHLRSNVHGPHHWHGKGHTVYLKVTLESAGDVRAVSPGFLFELPVPLFVLPIKLHFEAPWLSHDCYVGSDDEPILWTPFVTGSPASFDSAGDPNGFSTEVLTFTGMPLADSSLAAPGAEGCGHDYRRDRRRHHRSEADRLLDAVVGLPSPSGANEISLPSTAVAFAAAGFDGVAPDGGAELQASFDAAK